MLILPEREVVLHAVCLVHPLSGNSKTWFDEAGVSLTTVYEWRKRSMNKRNGSGTYYDTMVALIRQCERSGVTFFNNGYFFEQEYIKVILDDGTILLPRDIVFPRKSQSLKRQMGRMHEAPDPSGNIDPIVHGDTKDRYDTILPTDENNGSRLIAG